MNKKGKYLVVVLAVVLFSTGCARTHCVGGRFYSGYDPQLPLNGKIEKEETLDSYRRIKFSFDGISGESVPSLMAYPISGESPRPCIIFIHGIRQNKEFLDRIAEPFVNAGFAIVTFDQYTRGERRPVRAGPVRKCFALRRRCALTVIETRRLIDYLEKRPEIAAGRIYLLGASYGAIMGCTATAFDERIQSAVLTCGGGKFPVLFQSKAARKKFGIFLFLLKPVANLLFHLADPIRYVERISPRPLLFQNCVNDTLIPVAAAKALFEHAGEPKKITWYCGDHIGTDQDTIITVLKEAIKWFEACDRDIKSGTCRFLDTLDKSNP